MIPRAHRRRKVLWNAELRREDGDVVGCQMLDISAGGARIRTEVQFPPGTSVDLIVERVGVFPGTVLWQRGSHAGIGFLEDASSVELRLTAGTGASLMLTE